MSDLNRPIQIRFWGVRGSHPVPGPTTIEVGGNTSCVEVDAGGETIIFDSGSGIIPLGRDLLTRSQSRVAHIFLSHVHLDHIEGLRFFEPAYQADWQCWVYGYGTSLSRILGSVTRPPLFPISMRDLKAALHVKPLKAGSRVILSQPKPTIMTGRAAVPDDVPVVAVRHSRSHPKPGVTLFRLSFKGRTVVYATDVESAKGGLADVTSFARGVDVLIHDAQYLDDEYFEVGKVGWGHSTVRMAAEAAKAAEVGELILFHHAPQRLDAEVARLERMARAIFPLTRAAREGMELQLR